MGTDIHLYVEKFEDGKWHGVEPPYDTGYGYKSWSPFYKYRSFDFNEPDPEARNYRVFAFLADVRNGFGFAGLVSHRPISPQFAGRGIPEDTSWHWEYDEETGETISGVWIGDHSFTWATLTELLSAPWDMEFHSTGIVDRDGYESWKENGVPHEWSLGVGGYLVRKLPLNEFERLYKAGKLGEHDYTRVRWTWRPLENCGFKRWVFEVLKPLAGDDTDSIRVLMGFDS